MNLGNCAHNSSRVNLILHAKKYYMPKSSPEISLEADMVATHVISPVDDRVDAPNCDFFVRRGFKCVFCIREQSVCPEESRLSERRSNVKCRDGEDLTMSMWRSK